MFEGKCEGLEVKEVQSRESYASWEEGGQRRTSGSTGRLGLCPCYRGKGALLGRTAEGLSSASVLGASKGQVRRRTGEASSQKSWLLQA